MLGRHDFATPLASRHETARKALAHAVAEQNREAIHEENRRYHAELDLLKQDQARATASLKEIHAAQSQDLAREIREGGGAEKFREEEPAQDAPQTVRDEFRERVGKRIRRARKRDERGKGAGRERED